MILKKKVLLFIFGVVLSAYFVWKYKFRGLVLSYETPTSQQTFSAARSEVLPNLNQNVSTIYLAIVVCGDRYKEAFVLLKSALFFSKSPVHIIVFADFDLIQLFNKKLREWQSITKTNFNFDVFPVQFPADEFESHWRKLFKPCSSQRLFFPSLLKDVDSVLYVDTDTLFLAPLEQIWSHFRKMNSSQLAALAPEHEDPLTAWYGRFSRHPFYKPLGVNSGVMLMNLTRMRTFEWEKYLLPIYKEYKLKIPWGDQDIINIIFHFHPDKLYVYPCNYNYRTDHCIYSSVCKDAEKDGIIVLHGSREIFHSGKHPVFENVYKAMDEYSLGSDSNNDLYMNLKQKLDSSNQTNCWKVRHAFLRNMQRYINATSR